MITFEMYDNLMAARPYKFGPEDVGYIKSEDENKCEGCVHFYTRATDGYNVCELIRIVVDDDNEKPIEADYRCDFFTETGSKFPYLDGDI